MQSFYAWAKKKMNHPTCLKCFKKFCEGINTKHHLHHFFGNFVGVWGIYLFNPKIFNSSSYNVFFKIMLIFGIFFSYWYIKMMCFTSDGPLYKMVWEREDLWKTDVLTLFWNFNRTPSNSITRASKRGTESQGVHGAVCAAAPRASGLTQASPQSLERSRSHYEFSWGLGKVSRGLGLAQSGGTQNGLA